METLRSRLIHHGASVQFIGKICTLRLNASYRYKTEVEAILDNLRQEVRLQKVASHKALRKYQK